MSSRVAKPPKLRMDKTYGGESPLGKYKNQVNQLVSEPSVVHCAFPSGPSTALAVEGRSGSDFRKMHRCYWWMKGYDVSVSAETTTMCRLTCKTDLACTYNCVAEFTTFPDMPGAPSGWGINQAAFNPVHSHAAPYLPMNPDAENARRAVLTHDDPSLESPPLVPVAASGGMAGSASSGGGGGAGGVVGFAGAGSAAGSSAFGMGTNGGYQPSPQQPFFPSQQQQQHPFQQQPAAMVPQQQAYQPPPPMYQQPYGSPSFHSASPAFPSPTPGPPPRPPSSSSFPSQQLAQVAPPPVNQQDSHLSSTPLGAFLLQISPSFLPYLPLIDADLSFSSTSPVELVDLDSGGGGDTRGGGGGSTEDDRAVFDVFRQIPGLPAFHVALAADGVRKARRRRDKLIDEGRWNERSGSRLDPRIAVGLEKAKVERWVRERIRVGEGILAQRRQQGVV
ncbi:hypothetical protein JCM11641_001407 [Rhodosporidiobolus odoratus]